MPIRLYVLDHFLAGICGHAENAPQENGTRDASNMSVYRVAFMIPVNMTMEVAPLADTVVSQGVTIIAIGDYPMASGDC